MSSLAIETDPRGVARVTLNRPEVHNAFDEALIAGLTKCFAALGGDAAVRAIVLTGAGKSFSAGGDLNWMQRAAQQSEAANREDGLKLARMLHTLDRCPKPVIGLINGAAYGGGVGLTACCDIVIAAPQAQFGLTEVRLGIIPAAISPFVIAKIGVSAARRWMLTGARFDAAEAMRIGLVHQIAEDLAAAAETVVSELLASGPAAIGDVKALIGEVADHPVNDDMLALVSGRIAARRASAEGREGIAAFLEKRKPDWTK